MTMRSAATSVSSRELAPASALSSSSVGGGATAAVLRRSASSTATASTTAAAGGARCTEPGATACSPARLSRQCLAGYFSGHPPKLPSSPSSGTGGTERLGWNACSIREGGRRGAGLSRKHTQASGWGGDGGRRRSSARRIIPEVGREGRGQTEQRGWTLSNPRAAGPGRTGSSAS